MHRLVIALTTLIVLAGGTFLAAYLLIFAGVSDRAAALAPADTIAYVNVYLQPSTSQQMKLGALLGRLPGFEDTSTLDEKIDEVTQNLLSTAGLDYRADIRPWLGNQASLALRPAAESGAEPVAVAFLAVTDEAAAQAALNRVAEDDGATVSETDHQGVAISTTDGMAWAFVDDLLVVSSLADGIESTIDARSGESLADTDSFKRAMAELPPDHLASLYIDLSRAAQLAGGEAELSGWSVAGAALVVEEEGLRLTGVAPFDEAAASASARAGVALATEPSSLVEWMPPDTQAEAVIFGLRQTIEDAEAAAPGTPEGQQLTDALTTLRTVLAFGLGLDLDADLLPLLDREAAVAISGISDGLPTGQMLLRPTDPDAAAAVLTRLVDGLRGLGASVETEAAGERAEITVVEVPEFGQVAYTVVDGLVIIGFSADDVRAAITANETGDSLAATDAYTRTFELAGERAGNEIYVDLGAALEVTGAADGLPSDAQDILNELDTIGFTAPASEDRIEFRAVLTVE